jgi:ABC-2 type transport system ATP-binding protein
MAEHAIEIRSLAKSFKSTRVLDGLTLNVPAGETFAFLGRNAQGKTTTIRMLLGLMKPDAGEIRVLGLDPMREAIEIRRRVGYLAEDQTMFGWMRVSEMIDFMAPFYPSWDRDLAKKMVRRFELPEKTKIKHLSKGQNVRLGLLLAMAHNPQLVILDDPTLGLDPIMRKEFLRDVVEHLQGRGVTVFFSSHLLYEVEPVADAVAILEGGIIVRQAQTETLRDDVKRLVLSAKDYETMGELPGMLDIKRSGSQVALVIENAEETLRKLAAKGLEPNVIDLNLDEIFEAYVIGERHDRNHPKPALERVA